MVVLAAIGVALTVFVARSEAALAAVYTEGKRAGLKRGAEIARERGNIAIEISPEGGLGVGCIRGQMAHAIELEILGELVQR
jgi:hypothetical protein